MDKITTVSEYFERLDAPAHDALTRLREQLKRLVPESEEYIGYQIPTLRYKGRPLVGYGAASKHASFFVMSTVAMPKLHDILGGYSYSGVTIRFDFSENLPDDLLKAILAVRIAEVESMAPVKKKKTT